MNADKRHYKRREQKGKRFSRTNTEYTTQATQATQSKDKETKNKIMVSGEWGSSCCYFTSLCNYLAFKKNVGVFQLSRHRSLVVTLSGENCLNFVLKLYPHKMTCDLHKISELGVWKQHRRKRERLCSNNHKKAKKTQHQARGCREISTNCEEREQTWDQLSLRKAQRKREKKTIIYGALSFKTKKIVITFTVGIDKP